MDYLQEAKENFKDAQEACHEQYRRIREDFRFSNPSEPQQWDDVAKELRKGRPTHTLDRTNQFVQHVVNKHRESKTSADILPADSKADPEVAKRIKGIIRHIDYVSRSDIAWDTASDHQARGGLGWVRVLPKIVNPDTGEQDIVIQRVHDPLSCYLDPNSTEPDGQDAMFGFVETTLTNKTFERMWPKAQKANWDLSEGWFTEEKTRICEYFKVVETEVNKIVVNMGGEVTLTEDEYWKLVERTGIRPPFVRNSIEKTRTVKWCKLTGAEILEETEYPSQWIGLVPVMGHEIWVEGKRYLCGLVRRLMDGQRLHNYEMSALTESLMAQPKAPFLMPARAVEGYEQEWAALNSGNPAYLPYNDVTEQDTAIAAPMRLAPPNFPIAYANTANLAIQEMHASVGIEKPAFGANSSSVSGKAKILDQNASETATFHFADNRRISQQQVYRIVVDMLPVVYGTKQQAKILGEDGEQSSIAINTDMPTAIARQGRKIVAINPGVGKYDVRVKIGPSYTTIREEMGVKLQELAKGNPPLAAALTPILMKLSDMPESDKIERIVIAMLPPEIQAAYNEQDDDLPPAAKAQILAKDQQLQQANMLAEQATKVIQDLQEQLNDKNTEVKLTIEEGKNEIESAKKELEAVAKEITVEKKLLDKDKKIAQLEVKLWKDEAVNDLKTQETEMSEDDEMEKEALQMLAKAIAEGQATVAKALEKNTEVMTKLTELTVEAIGEMTDAASAERVTSIQKDPTTGAFTAKSSVAKLQ